MAALAGVEVLFMVSGHESADRLDEHKAFVDAAARVSRYDRLMSSIFLHEITGSVTFRERIELPRGSVASVKLINRKAEVLAATAFEVFQVPMDFTLYVDRADAPDPSKLSVWAVIRSEAGVWGTPDFVSAAELPVTIHLRKIDVEE